MEITLNGEPRALPGAISVAALLRELELTEKRVAVERNGVIVPRSRHDQTTLAAGDRVEIVHAIGGG